MIFPLTTNTASSIETGTLEQAQHQKTHYRWFKSFHFAHQEAPEESFTFPSCCYFSLAFTLSILGHSANRTNSSIAASQQRQTDFPENLVVFQPFFLTPNVIINQPLLSSWLKYENSDRKNDISQNPFKSALCKLYNSEQQPGLDCLLSHTTHLYIHLNEDAVDQLGTICYSIQYYSFGDLIFVFLWGFRKP